MASPLQRTAMGCHLPPLGMLPSGKVGKGSKRRRGDLRPIHWKTYFDSAEMIPTKSGQFRVYFSGSVGPWIVMLHGGGFSGLSWACFSKCVREMVDCRVLAIDLRGHGETHLDDEDDMSIARLANDVGEVVGEFLSKHGSPEDAVILLGHSMGGAIAVRVAHAKLIPSLAGLALIDIVEGSALEALSAMHGVLQSRPKTFTSVEHAIRWCVESGQVRNMESACVSMPGQMVNTRTGKLCASEVPEPGCEPEPSSVEASHVERHESLRGHAVETISEDQEFMPPRRESFESDRVLVGEDSALHTCKWRIDLSRTEKFWQGWFENLSDYFLECSIPKLLILAGIDRLDKKMTVGQMQGKFQMMVLPHVGHVVHEDKPDSVAEIIATFLTRFKMAESLAAFKRPMPSC